MFPSLLLSVPLKTICRLTFLGGQWQEHTPASSFQKACHGVTDVAQTWKPCHDATTVVESKDPKWNGDGSNMVKHGQKDNTWQLWCIII